MVMTYKAVAREVPEGWQVRMTVGHDVHRQVSADGVTLEQLEEAARRLTMRLEARRRHMDYYFGVPVDEPKPHFEERTMKLEMEDRGQRLRAMVAKSEQKNSLHRALKAPAAVLGLGLILGGCQSTAGGTSRWSPADLIAAVSTTCSFVVASASAEELVAMLGPKYGTIAALASAVCRSVERVAGPRGAPRAGPPVPRLWGTLDGVRIIGNKR